jgi:hypothetical protein
MYESTQMTSQAPGGSYLAGISGQMVGSAAGRPPGEDRGHMCLTRSVPLVPDLP